MNDVKIQYFRDYWKDVTAQNNSIEEELTHGILYNPREFFKEFAEEIERKNLSNGDNKKFFINKINEFSKLDLQALSFLHPTLKLIRQQFSNKDDYSYLQHLVEMIIIELSDFKLGIEAVSELAIILTNESVINKNKIKHLINIIIFELVQKKYSHKKIVQIVDDIFSLYQDIDKGWVHSSFPHKFICDNHDKTSEEYKVYRTQLIDYIDNLSNQERISALANYFEEKGKNLRFVFQIKGLKGDAIDITLGNVQIYNPKFVQLFNKPTEHFNELFAKENKDGIVYCNGAVSLEVIDTEFAKEEALQILDNALDIVASRYINYKIPISINKFKYFIISSKGNEMGMGMGGEWGHLIYQDSIELVNEDYEDISKFYSIPSSTIDKKIVESLHWKRKAIEATEVNEKILWHWIALENLIESPREIFSVVSKLSAKKQLYKFAWKHFHKLSILTDKRALFHNKKELNLSDELIDEIGFNKEGAVYLKNFMDNMELIKEHIQSPSLLLDQLEYLGKIFTDKKKCIELLEAFEKSIFEKLVYVYRIRNKIVHTANSEQNPLINFYLDFITDAVSMVVFEFQHKRNYLSLSTNEEIIHNILYDFDKFKIDLQDKGTEILL